MNAVLIEATPTAPAPQKAAPVPSRLRAAVAGGCAGLAAISAGELVAAVIGSPISPLTAIGNEFIDSFAASLKELAVAVFGTHDKDALVAGIVVVATALAAGLGIASRHWRHAAPVGIIFFGVIGGRTLAIDPQGSVGDALITAGTAIAGGLLAFYGLWSAAVNRMTDQAPTTVSPPANEVAPTRRIDRRRFLLASGGVVVISGIGTVVARQIRAGDTVAAARRSTVLPRPVRSVTLPVEQPFAETGLTDYVTPTADFYRIDTALITPQVRAGSWTLSVHGLVDHPFELSYAELLAMDSVETPVTLQCVSNEVGGSLVGNAVWQGVPLRDLLERAGVSADAAQVFTRSVDGFSAGFPLADAIDGRTAIVAYAMNGEPLPAEHGYPARMVVAGLYGYVSATKWLTSIELTPWEGVDGYWIPRGWSKEGPIKTTSRIDVPRGDITAGRHAIAGVAWAPNLGIERVEVQVDDGDWHSCELGRAANDDTWVQWWLGWDASPGSHTLRVRATDRGGRVQTPEERPPAPDGATGHHTRTIEVS